MANFLWVCATEHKSKTSVFTTCLIGWTLLGKIYGFCKTKNYLIFIHRKCLTFNDSHFNKTWLKFFASIGLK